MTPISRWIVNNLGLMGLAFVLAFVVWLFNTTQEDPIIEGDVPARVIVKQPDAIDLAVTSSVPPTVTVRVRAPLSTLRTVNELESARVSVDLNTLSVGEHVVTLSPVLNLEPAQLLSSRPITAVVLIERLVQRSLPVRISPIGQPALGYQQLEPRIDVPAAVVSATEKTLARVSSVDAIISVDDVRASIIQRARLVARDAEGDIVNGVTVAPNEAVVTVPIEQLSNVRTLAVSVKTRGAPADNYATTSITAEPNTLTVQGNKDEIQKLPGFIETLPVNLEGATQSIEERVGLQIPPGVTLVGDNTNFSVQVRVRIEAQSGARTVSRQPVLIGLSPEMQAIVSPESVDLVLSGPLPKLNAIDEQGVQVFLNLTNLPEGVHQVTPTIVKPDNVTAQVTLPSIQVQILPKAPVETPTATP